MVRKYIPRIPTITFKIDNKLNLIESNRGFLRMFNIPSLNSNFGDFLNEEDKSNFIAFLKNYNPNQVNKVFLVNIYVRAIHFNCLLYVEKNENFFDIELKELDYNRELYENSLIKAEEYSNVLRSVDSYYFVYNCDINRVTFKSSKSLGNLFDVSIDGISNYIENYLKISLDLDKNRLVFDELVSDLKNNIDKKTYVLKSEDNTFSFSTKKIEISDKRYIVSSIIAGEKMILNTSSYLENNDALTDLYNKKTITEIAKNRIEKTNRPCSIFVMDIDKFKECNDNFGHQYGDEVLKNVGQILKDSLGSSGIAGRIGGDEFMCIVDQIDNEEIRNIMRNIKIGLQWSMPANHPNNTVTCSIGVSRFPYDGNTFDKLFEIADKCLYIAKNKGRNCYIIYNPDMHERVFLDNKEKQERILDGTEYKRIAEIELNILDILRNKKNNWKYDALKMLKDYICASNIILYDKNYNVEISLENDENIREGYLKETDYFEFFNKEGYFLCDNTNNIEPINKKKSKMYQRLNIASTLEIKLEENGEFKGLLVIDVYKPARTFNPIGVVFSLMASKYL